MATCPLLAKMDMLPSKANLLTFHAPSPSLLPLDARGSPLLGSNPVRAWITHLSHASSTLTPLPPGL